MKRTFLTFLLIVCILAVYGQYSKIYEFTKDNDLANAQLSEPVTDGSWIYHMVSLGGTYNMGAIYKVRPDGSEYTKLYDFTGGLDGKLPQGSLLLSGGVLYGMTREGGLYTYGVVFKLNTDGSGFTTLLHFDGTGNGRNPYGSLIISGTTLYGMTFIGGASNVGSIFKISTSGTGYTKIYDFTGAASGINPQGALPWLATLFSA